MERDNARRLKTKQEQQTEVMATLLLVIGAREGVTNLFDKEGVAQLCRFRAGLMMDEPTFPDYCYMTDGGNESKTDLECNYGDDPLPFFYGDATYDIVDLDLEVFKNANFDAIFKRAFTEADVFGAIGEFGAADTTAVMTVVGKLFGYLTGVWSEKTYVCKEEYAKDPDKVLAVLAAMRSVESLDLFDGLLNQYFDSNFTVDNPVSRYTKGRYYYGAPFKGFDNYIDQEQTDAQEAQYQQWWGEKRFRELYPEGESEMWPTAQPTVLNTALLLSELLGLLLGDGLRAVAPVIVVTGIVWLQTGSLFIALVTIFEIIISLGIAVFATTSLFGIKWLSFQVALALYIVLAIGADDVFVFMDAYKQSFYRGSMVNESLTTRIAWVYRRAGLAMLITSFTTCAAFIASALTSPIPELQNFGIFAACVIFADYIMVMTFLCANCIVFHNYFETKPGLCCSCCQPCAPHHKCMAGGCSKACDFSGETLSVTTTKIAQEGKASEEAKSRLVTLFEDTFPFDTIVKPKPMRYASILTMLILLVLASISASGIEPQTSTEDFLPDDHPFQRYSTWNNEFDSSNFDRTVEMNFVWGFKELDPLDQTGVNLILEADFKGVPNYDANFEMTADAQDALLDACEVLEAADVTKVDIDTDTGNSTVLVSCFIRAFRDYQAYLGEPFPLSTHEAAVEALLTWSRDDNETLPAEVTANGFTRFASDLGWKLGKKDELELAYVKLRAYSKINERGFLPAATTRALYDEWQAVLADVNDLTKKTELGAAFQVSGMRTGRPNKWIFMTVQEAYLNMALVGAAAGLGIATAVLLIATRNVLMTAACIGTILAALICVVGTIVAMGWQLGSNESLSIMVLTGFAVDYVVHLSHAYMESKALKREERVHDALRDLGVSVFWGMLTSLCAASALASCQLQNLSKFGIFFALTISYAYLWSVLFLMPLLAIVGPQPNAKEHELSYSHQLGTGATLKPIRV